MNAGIFDRSQDYSFPGTFVPGTIRSRDRILRGKFIPLTTTVAIIAIAQNHKIYNLKLKYSLLPEKY